jgi:tetratricopeptide (TPR) repeat protein
MDAYAGMGQHEKALALTDSALAVNPSSELFLFAKSTTLLRMERYAESIKYSERLIELNPNLAEPYFNAGTAYVNIAERLAGKNDKKLMKQAYQKACPFVEHYRKLMPKEKAKWAPVLYRIYLNLNMGRQFDEIDRLLKEK